MNWEQDNLLKNLPLSMVSPQNSLFPQVFPSVLAVLRFPCLNKLCEVFFCFSGAASFPYTCNQAFIFLSEPSRVLPHCRILPVLPFIMGDYKTLC